MQGVCPFNLQCVVKYPPKLKMCCCTINFSSLLILPVCAAEAPTTPMSSPLDRSATLHPFGQKSSGAFFGASFSHCWKLRLVRSTAFSDTPSGNSSRRTRGRYPSSSSPQCSIIHSLERDVEMSFLLEGTPFSSI